MPPEEERHFVSFERRTITSSKKAWQLAYISAAAFAVLVLVTVFSFDPPKNQHAEDLETSLSAEQELDEAANKPQPKQTEPAPAPEQGSDEAGGTEDGAEGGGEGDTGGEEGSEAGGAESGAAPAAGTDTKAAEAPPPPKGATKAPPTALVGDKK